MVDRDLIVSKIAELESRLGRIRHRSPESVQSLEASLDTLDLIAFNLLLVVQAAGDIASHIIADRRWRPTDSLGEAFVRLAEHGVIERPTAEKMVSAVGLRNVVAHGYAAVKPSMIYEAATVGIADLEAFIRQISAWMVDRS